MFSVKYSERHMCNKPELNAGVFGDANSQWSQENSVFLRT